MKKDDGLLSQPCAETGPYPSSPESQHIDGRDEGMTVRLEKLERWIASLPSLAAHAGPVGEVYGGILEAFQERGMSPALLASDLRAARVTWQPIESAPTDGRPFLGWSDEGVAYVCWAARKGWCFFSSGLLGVGNFYFQPTHWMPLPSLPGAEGTATG